MDNKLIPRKLLLKLFMPKRIESWIKSCVDNAHAVELIDSVCMTALTTHFAAALQVRSTELALPKHIRRTQVRDAMGETAPLRRERTSATGPQLADRRLGEVWMRLHLLWTVRESAL